MIAEDELCEGQGIALAEIVADVEAPELVQAIRPQLAGLGHVVPDAVFELAGPLMGDASIDGKGATGEAVVVDLIQAQGWLCAILALFDQVGYVQFWGMRRLDQAHVEVLQAASLVVQVSPRKAHNEISKALLGLDIEIAV